MLLTQKLLMPKSQEVSRELYTRVSDFLNTPKIGKFKSTDADKNLELDICRELFGIQSQVLPPTSLDEEFAEIDAYVDGESIQIKCRNDSNFLILEDYKTRSNGEKTSWVDRNVAQYTLFVNTNYEPCLRYCIYETSDLKRLLILLRAHRLKQEISEKGLQWLNKYFKNWKYNKYITLNKGRPTESAIYKILI